MTGYADRSTVRRQPIYLLLDVSESMWRKDRNGVSSLDVFQPMIDKLVLDLGGMPRINVSVWLSVLAFSDGVEELRAMSPLIAADQWITPPTLGQETNYLLALRALADRYPNDAERIRQGVARAGHQTSLRPPLVFIFTDGAPFADGRDQPDDSWQRERERVTGDRMRAWIAAASVRREHERILWELATGSHDQRNAFLAEPDSPAEALAASIRQCIAMSIQQSVRAGEQVMRVPHGMKRAQLT
ncbi:vWA domain-containing protein [Actinoplanes regularis]|uniref:Uncharacterized conserved protein YegL, contains vWA domain of TerY type n=1 Tax=Actinoplanes regularis TaxID=52697 RepID=A0A239C3Z4_9ACTN|nr:hypothetical protein [Actinoplanes regularis]GIE88118.1 hypothetical protein Are01nite_45980 [Actinoplanes regularis]GLW35694.1 hypothetical protein Areg01_86290 [Actinoplanes regularis]SNS14995.1 Uncharacterized conserved protein YegL, contains vWA domain of TerY type [Actinoplanes regularis]